MSLPEGLDETQRLEDLVLDDEFKVQEDQAKKPLAKLRVLKNEHIPETELPLYLGENVLGRDPCSCSLPLCARSVSRRHAVISLSVFHGDKIHKSPVVEALLWDLGSMNGTRKGRFRLTPHVRYALSEGESVVLADLPCQYISLSEVLQSWQREAQKVRRGTGCGRGVRTPAGKDNESAEPGESNSMKDTTIQGNDKSGSEVAAPNMVGGGVLSLARTPAQFENLLVLELDSDSDDDQSTKTGPACSTFLSPMNNVVPESEDEHSITPISSVKEGADQRMNQGGTKMVPPMLPYESDTDLEESRTSRASDSSNGLENKANEKVGLPAGMAIDSIHNRGTGPTKDVGMFKGEAEPFQDMPEPSRATSQLSIPDKGTHPTAEDEGKQNVLLGDSYLDGCPGSSGNSGSHDHNKPSIPVGPTAGKPGFTTDSDTDAEGEEGAQQTFGLVREAEATEQTATTPNTSEVQPAEFHLDSDTDVEDNVDDVPVSLSTSSLTAKPASTPSVVRAKFPLDSDTNLEGSGKPVPQTEADTGLTDPFLTKRLELNLDSNKDGGATDDEPFAPSERKIQESPQPIAREELELKIQSDSDTDVECDTTQLFASASKSSSPVPHSDHQPASHRSAPGKEPLEFVPASNRDVEEPASVRRDPEPHPRKDALSHLDGDTDVEGEVQEMETQVFPDTSDPFRRPHVPPPLLQTNPENDKDDPKDDDDFFIAETQSFVAETAPKGYTRGPVASQPCILCTPPSLVSSSPQGINEQTTLEYSFELGATAANHQEPSGLGGEEELIAAQTYGKESDLESSGAVEMDGELEATQAYVTEAAGEMEGAMQFCTDDTDVQDGKQDEGDQQMNFHAYSHLSTADTQPVSALEEGAVEVSLAEEEDKAEVENDEDEGGEMLQSLRRRGLRKEENVQLGRSTRSRRRGGVNEGGECLELVKRQRRRTSKIEETRKGKGSRGKGVLDEDKESDIEEDESEKQIRKGTGRTKGRKSAMNRKQKDRLESKGNERDENRGLKEDIRGKEKERKESESNKQGERKRLEKERKEREEREEKERLEKEREEREEKERLEKEREEREEKERLEKEREEREERERLEKEREEREERERLEKEREEREERERLEKEREEREERERQDKVHGDREKVEKEQEEMEGGWIDRKLARGKRKLEQVSKEVEGTKNDQGEKGLRSSTRATRKTSSRGAAAAATSADKSELCEDDTATPKPQLKQETRARSRSSSVTSVSSEKSVSSTGAPERSHLRRKQKGADLGGDTTLGTLSTPASEAIVRGRANRGATVSSGTAARKTMQLGIVEEHSNTCATKGANTDHKETDQRAPKATNPSDSVSTEADRTSEQAEADGEELLPYVSNSRNLSRRQDLKEVLGEGEETNGSKVPANRQKSQRAGKRRAEELQDREMCDMEVEEVRSEPSARKGRLSKKSKKEERKEWQGEHGEEEASTGSVERKIRGRKTVAQRQGSQLVMMSEEQQTEEGALDQNADPDGVAVKTEVPRTPVGRPSQKRVTSSGSPSLAKTSRRTPSRATSPVIVSGSLQSPKVLFTGMTDNDGEAVVSRLGGSMARGVADMTLLVTDKVRRTVKFLCAVARGIPVVTISWLDQCRKNSMFLSPQAFLVKDVEQERKFNFCLEEALQTARTHPLLQGYEIYVTRSVKPEPAQMKEIITCSGARYLTKMPTVLKPQTVVISCVEDAPLCVPALSASIPVLSAEFLLTGILQQKIDLVTHSLVGPEFKVPENVAFKGRRKW